MKVDASQYGTALQQAMKAATERTGQKMSIRQVAHASGFSYEHVRRILTGAPVASRDFNDRVASFLQLDAADMWAIARREKLAHKYGFDATENPETAMNPRLVSVWADLDEEERQRIVDIAVGLVAAKRLRLRLGSTAEAQQQD